MSVTNLSKLEECAIELHKIGAVKFGDFTLKSGIKSPIYFDLRIIISYPELLEIVADLMWETVEEKQFDHICGVPYTALPIASVLSVKYKLPMLIRRKEMKSYGTKKMIEGKYSENQNCLLIEDVVSTGSSVIETAHLLRKEKLKVQEAIVFLDRQQGGRDNLTNSNINLKSVLTIHEMLKILQKHRKIDDISLKNTMNYLESFSNVSLSQSSTALLKDFSRVHFSLMERAEKCENGLTRRLLTLMDKKRSNLCVALDVETSDELISLAAKLGPYICILKTHIDVINDFTSATIESLKNLALEHEFLLFEDRKFADIGNTVKMQYTNGVHRIYDWAHLVTAHALAGPGVLQGLLAAGQTEDRGCIIIAEMSCAENLITPKYTEECLELREKYRQIVVGFVCQSSLHSDPDVILFTPGVSLDASDDALGQKYISPEKAIIGQGADVIIVGRGIIKDADPAKAAKEYRDRGYAALISRIKNY